MNRNLPRFIPDTNESFRTFQYKKKQKEKDTYGKKILLTIVNILIIGLPFYFIWGIKFYFLVVLFQLILIGVLFWNGMGDFLVLRFVFAGNPLPNNAEIKIAIDNYIKHIYFKKNGKYPYKAKIVWVDSELPFFVPVSRRAFVVSVALQDSIIDFGEVFLLRNFPENSYNQAILYSRKCLLLTFIGYKISLRFLELWAVFF